MVNKIPMKIIICFFQREWDKIFLKKLVSCSSNVKWKELYITAKIKTWKIT